MNKDEKNRTSALEGRKDAESQQDESYHSLVILVPI